MSGSERRFEGIWKAALLLACLAAALAAFGASASAKPKAKSKPKAAPAGRLDPSFGKGGKATVAFPAENAGDVGVTYSLPFQFTAGNLEMALAPSGKIAIANSTRVAQLLPNGKPDPGFGAGGAVAIEQPSGQRFVLADVAVDSQGRILVAGSVRPQPADSTPDPLISSAMVARFAADGSVDRSFGKEGTLITDFGIEPPRIGTGRYKGAAVGLHNIVVDSQDRPLLTGGFVSRVGCEPTSGDRAISTAFVARLSEGGAPDPSFANGGLRQITDFASFEQGSLFPFGTLLAVGTRGERCSGEGGSQASITLTSFGPEGNLDPNFGFAGFRVVGYRSTPVIAIAPSGKIVLLGERGDSQLVMRLLPNGGFDPSFGQDGRVEVELHKGAAFSAVAVDARGRLIFAGRVAKRAPGKHSLTRLKFFLARMNAPGGFDREFGRKGAVVTGFGGGASSFATQVVLDPKGRILVGGKISTPSLATGGGYALARYLAEPKGGKKKGRS